MVGKEWQLMLTPLLCSGLYFTLQIHRTASFPFSYFPHIEAHVWYDLVVALLYDTICWLLLYNINLRATITTILSIRGVTIPIYLVSSTTDSIRQHVVLFKPVPIPTSDPKSEFLCQSSIRCKEPADSPEHLVRLGYLPCPRHHVSPILP